MKIYLYIADTDLPLEPREESYHVPEDTDILMYGLCLVNYWNSSLREHDIPRLLISAKRCGKSYPMLYPDLHNDPAITKYKPEID